MKHDVCTDELANWLLQEGYQQLQLAAQGQTWNTRVMYNTYHMNQKVIWRDISWAGDYILKSRRRVKMLPAVAREWVCAMLVSSHPSTTTPVGKKDSYRSSASSLWEVNTQSPICPACRGDAFQTLHFLTLTFGV